MDKQTIAVIGGGMTGIAAALELARAGHFDVTIYEKRDHLGGLSDYYQWNGVSWDRFYHVILSTDTVMLEFVKSLNLEHEIVWRETRSGFYGDGRLVSLSSHIDFLRFPFLNIFQKLRLALGVLYCARIKDPTALDRVYVTKWLTRVFGRRVFERMWDPLLRSKLGDARHRTSAAFIWSTIRRLYGARSAGSQKEQMGYVQGGYRTILNAAEQRLKDLGVRVITNANLTRIRVADVSSGGPPVGVESVVGSQAFNRALLTVPCPDILKLLRVDIEAHSYWKTLDSVEYLGVICVLLMVKNRLSPYYVINLLDRTLPFTGVIEVTNLVSAEEVGHFHLVYLPKYLPADHPMNRLSDGEIIEEFKTALLRMFPEIEEGDIAHAVIFRERYVQPLQEVDFLKRDKGFSTPMPGVYVVNSSMIYNSTLNNNAAITLAKRAAAEIGRDLPRCSDDMTL